MYKKLEKSFTLIELLVVIAIVGILAGLIILTMSDATEQARIAKLKVYGNSIRDVLGGNLVSEWNFESGLHTDGQSADTTDLKDTWSTNDAITVSGPLIKEGTNCVTTKCLYFDGVDDYVDLGNPSTLYPNSNMTISLWIKPTLLNSSAVFGKFNGSTSVLNWTYGLWIYTTGYLGFGIGNGTTNNYKQSIYNVSANNWSSVVINYMGSNNLVKFYINGQYISGSDLTLAISPIINSNSYYIGGGAVSGRYYSGLIDDVRIYNVAIPVSQIRANYLAGLDGLLTKGAITKGEYDQRISKLNSSYAEN